MSSFKQSPAQQRYVQCQTQVATMYSQLRAYESIVPSVRKVSTHFKLAAPAVCEMLGFPESNIPDIVRAVGSAS